MSEWETVDEDGWETVSTPEPTRDDRIQAVGSGANRGIAGLLGLPVDTAINVWDLLKAGAGVTQGAVTGRAPSSIFDPADRSQYVGSGEYLSNLMNKTPVTTTQMRRPDDKASQYLYAGGSALPGIATARPETLPQLMSATSANLIPTLAGKAATDASRGTQFENTAPILASLTAQAAPSALSYASKNLAQRKIEPETERAATTLTSQGVDLDAAQATGSANLNRVKSSLFDNPFTAGKQVKKAEQQAKQFTKAALRSIGEDADAATPAVMKAAKRRIGDEFDRIAEKNPVKFDSKLQSDVSDLVANASRELQPGQLTVLQKQVDDILNKAAPTGAIDGKAYANTKSSLDRVSGGQDQAIGHYARQLRNALDDALQRSTSKRDYNDLIKAREQWGNMRTIERAIDKKGDGLISPSVLANQFGMKKNAAKAIYGAGDQRLVQLAQAGKKILPDQLPNSGTAPRMMMQAVPAAIGAAVAGAASGNPLPALGVAASYYGIPATLQRLINSGALTGTQQISDPRLLQYAAQQGLLAGMDE